MRPVRFPSPSLGELCLATAVAMLTLHSVGTAVGLVGVPAIQWTRTHWNPLTDVVVLVTNLVAVAFTTVLLSWAARSERVSLLQRNRQVLSVAAMVSVVLASQVVFRFVGYQVQGLIMIPIGDSARLDALGFFGMQLLLRAVLPITSVALLLGWNARRRRRADAEGAG